MEGRNISLWGKPTTEDFRRVLFWYRWKRLAISLFGLIFVFGLVTVYLVNTRPQDPSTDRRFIAYILFAIVPAFVVMQSYVTIRRNASKLAALSQGTQYKFDEDGVESIGLAASGRMDWDRYIKVIETANDFIFFPQENLFYPVPKRFFEGEAQIAELRSLIAEKLGSKAKLQN